MNNTEYHESELRRYYKKIEGILHAPLSDRQGARTELKTDCIESPALIAERLEWMYNGTYGYAEKVAIEKVLEAYKKNKKNNKNAQLFNLIALNEWMSPDANKVYNSLTKEQQDRLNEAINNAEFKEAE